VDPVALRRFTERFAAAGLRPGVVMPVYGLAEATLAATFPPLARPWRSTRVDGARLGPGAAVGFGPTATREVVSVGCPVAGHELRIQLDGRTLGDDMVGEIQLRGPAVMTGYYGDPAATAETLCDGWLATGDLGFTHGGELYVTGRLKEMMILHGRNYYPHDVEELVQGLPGCHRSMAVAFAGQDSAGEHMVLVAETKLVDPADCAEFAAASQRAVRTGLAIPRLEVVLVKPGAVPRTTSGKRQRLLVKAQLHRPDFAAAVIWSTRAAATQVSGVSRASGTSP
jgi:acyl-CoA synthetase (AMP-forming)/AMP-acid ligase II